MLIRSDVDQNLLSKFTNTTSDSRMSDQRLRSKRTGSLSAFVIDRKVWKKFFFRSEQIERYWLDKQQLKVLESLGLLKTK